MTSTIARRVINSLVFYEITATSGGRYYQINGRFTRTSIRFPFMVIVGNQTPSFAQTEICIHSNDNSVTSQNGLVTYENGTLIVDTKNAGWCRCVLVVQDGDFIPA